MMTTDEWAMGMRHPVEGLNRHLPLHVSSGMWPRMECEPDWRWPTARKRHVRCSYTVQNMCRQGIPRVELWVCAPLRDASAQQVRTMKSSPPCEEIRDSLGNHLLRFTFHNVAPFAVRIATVEATLELGSTQASGPMTGQCGWRKDHRLDIPRGHGDRILPRTGGKSEEDIRELYERAKAYPREAMSGDGRRMAGDALSRLICDGEAEAIGFVALCRQAGIPARAMGGYLLEGNGLSNPGVFRYWAEFHLNDRWHLADPSRGVFMEPADAYIAIRVLGQSDRPIGKHDKCCAFSDRDPMVMEG